MIFFLKIPSSTWVRINCALSFFVLVFSLANFFKDRTVTKESEPHEVNACCGFPCQNGGVCVSEGTSYACDCTNTGCFGKNCEIVVPRQWLNKLIKFNPTEAYTSIINYFPLVWRALNSIAFFRNVFTKNLYMTTVNWGNAEFRWASTFDLISIDSYRNSSFSARSLPPIPKSCPTPMGVRGPKQLPPPSVLYESVLKRTTFETCPLGTNVLFATYIQHFVSQFDSYGAEESKQHEWGNNIIDMSHIYGKDDVTRQGLRSHHDGKLKSRVFEGEEYPPYLEDCPGVDMMYPQTHHKSFMSKMMMESRVEPQWALGNPGLSMTTMLFVMSTIWLREHNRVCTILANDHRHWSDEKLYQTAKVIVAGEVIKITLTEFMQHLMQTKMEIQHKPELTSHLKLQFTASVPKEFSLLPHWHSSTPEQLLIASEPYNVSQLTFSNNQVVFQHGLDRVIHAMTTQPAGKITSNNVGGTFQYCVKYLIEESRALRTQSFNNYRRRFELKPAESFEELTGDLETAAVLKELYSDIEAVELVVGLLVEHQGTGVAPPSMTTMSGAWLIRGLISHPINSPDWWKPSSFGGEIGMNIIKSASLKKLICLNMKNKCHDIHVGFKIPSH